MSSVSTLPPVLSLPSFAAFLHSEPLALDLVNTRLYLGTGWVDLLDHRPERTQWLSAEAPRLNLTATEVATFTRPVAEAVQTVRTHAAAAIDATRRGARPPAGALSGLNAALRAAPAVPQARCDGAVVVTTTARTGPLASRLAAGFAQATLELLAGPDITAVRRCDAPDCVMLFLPRSSRRRWCTPAICGNRTRVARYYHRHKPAGRRVADH